MEIFDQKSKSSTVVVVGLMTNKTTPLHFNFNLVPVGTANGFYNLLRDNRLQITIRQYQSFKRQSRFWEQPVVQYYTMKIL